MESGYDACEMSRTSAEMRRQTEPPPPTTVASEPGPTPIDWAAPLSSRATFASGAGHAPPATVRLPTRGGVSGSGLIAAGSSLPPALTTPDWTMYIGVVALTCDSRATSAYRAGAAADWVPTHRSGPFRRSLVAA
ncbi:MAG: hypothetical protein E6J08_14645 [Chloroflexi bacterium]|nr:MAG: hypothetical protein E6J08_14645 [Chloroflexota bacterium]